MTIHKIQCYENGTEVQPKNKRSRAKLVNCCHYRFKMIASGNHRLIYSDMSLALCQSSQNTCTGKLTDYRKSSPVPLLHRFKEDRNKKNTTHLISRCRAVGLIRNQWRLILL